MGRGKAPVTNAAANKRLAELNDDWKLRAACRDMPYMDGKYDLYFDLEDKTRVHETKVFCYLSCTVREYCLLWALFIPEPYGIWGGLDPDERKELRLRPEIKSELAQIL